MAISGLMSNTALPPALLAAAGQPALAAGDIVAARVVGQAANGASQLAIGKQVLSVALPEHPPTGTVLLLQVAGGEAGRRFTVLAEVPPEAAAHTALVPPNARLRLLALGLMPGETFTGTVVSRTAGGLTRLAIGDTLIDMLLPRPVASGETVRLQMPRDRTDPALLQLVEGDAAPPLMRQDQIALDQRARAALSRLGVAPGAPVTARVMGPNLVAIGEEVLHLPLNQSFPAGTLLNLQRSDVTGDHLLLLSATMPGAGADANAVRVAPASLPQLQALGVRPGQRLDAEVLGRLASGETEIVINGRGLTVTLPAAAAAGSRLTLTVQGSVEQPRLALLPGPIVAPPTDLAGLRQMALAGQGSLGTVLAGLARLHGAPSTIAEAATPLLQAALPADGDISATDLRQALRNSGIFLEAGGSPAAGDIKAALMGLRGALAAWLGLEAATASGARRPLPPNRGSQPRAHHMPLDAGDMVQPRSLLADTDAALNRLRLMQLASLPDPSLSAVQKAALFTAEIPLQLGQELSLAQFQVVRDGGGQAVPETPGERGWQMRFAVSYAVIGEVGAQITLRGRRVSVALWAERPATAAALRSLLPELGPGLVARGIEPVALNCRLGRPSEARAAPSGQYVDAIK